jgi:putative two-component system response regulator
MTHSNRWLWLVLISSVQLCGLLAMIVFSFSWQSDQANRAVEHVFLHENLSVAARIKAAINGQANSESSVDSNLSFETFKDSQATRFISDRYFVGLFDSGKKNFVEVFTPDNPILPAKLVTNRVHSFDEKKELGPAENLLNEGHRSFTGWQVHDEQRVILSAEYLPRYNGSLVVAQTLPQTTAQVSHAINSSASSSFAFTLVVGLIAISMTGMVISRINQTVQGLNGDLEKVVNHSTSELLRSKNAVIFGLAKLAESRDNDTGEHLERIRIYVTILAKELARSRMDFDERLIHDLALASSLHDIGKVGIPDSILLKPGRLTPEERGIMEIHTLIGGECLDAIQGRLGDNEFMSIARQIAFYHHERWDGTGYPHSLKGPEIPLVARIVAVADVYDALTSKRPYKRAMTHAESKEIILAGTGKQFDPEIVEAFLKHEAEFEAVSLHQQNLTDDQVTSNFQRLCDAAKAETTIQRNPEAMAAAT